MSDAERTCQFCKDQRELSSGPFTLREYRLLFLTLVFGPLMVTANFLPWDDDALSYYSSFFGFFGGVMITVAFGFWLYEWVKRDLLGRTVYLFQGDDGQVHCHMHMPHDDQGYPLTDRVVLELSLGGFWRTSKVHNTSITSDEWTIKTWRGEHIRLKDREGCELVLWNPKLVLNAIEMSDRVEVFLWHAKDLQRVRQESADHRCESERLAKGVAQLVDWLERTRRTNSKIGRAVRIGLERLLELNPRANTWHTAVSEDLQWLEYHGREKCPTCNFPTMHRFAGHEVYCAHCDTPVFEEDNQSEDCAQAS